MVLLYILLLTADASLGKVDKSTLSQQTLMELFTEGITNRSVVCGSHETPEDFSEWKNVSLDERQKIESIVWSEDGLEGTIDLSHLPDGVQRVDISNNKLAGEVDLEHSARSLTALRLDSNAFTDSLKLTRLPQGLQYLYLQSNAFTGSVSLTRLPASMENLDISSNMLSGSLDLTQLPPHLRELSLSANSFHGLTDFTQLPEELEVLRLENLPQLSGELLLIKGRSALKRVRVHQSDVTITRITV